MFISTKVIERTRTKAQPGHIYFWEGLYLPRPVSYNTSISRLGNCFQDSPAAALCFINIPKTFAVNVFICFPR